MSDNQFRKHLNLFEGFWDSEETAQQIIDSLSEEDVANLTSDEVYRLVDEFVEMGDSPHAADRDDIAQIIMDRLNVEAEVDYGDGMHDRENEDYEEYVEPSGVDSGWNFESVKLSRVVESVLGEEGSEEDRIIKKLMSKEDKKWNPSTLTKIRDKLREFSRNLEYHKIKAEEAISIAKSKKQSADSYDDEENKANPNWKHNQGVNREAEQEYLAVAKRHVAAIVQLKKERMAFLKSLIGIKSESLEEAPRKKMPPRQKVPTEPVDDFEDEFAAPERPVDVGDDIDFEDNIDDLDLDNLGIYVELDDY